jgi:hypothetical protein
VTVEAGGEAGVWLRIRNTYDVVEEYHVDVVGDPAMWCTAEPASLRLFPGTTGSVRLTFAPPRSPDAAAGPHPYGVRVRPVEVPDAVTVPEGNVSVVPFVDVRAELLPVTVRGWRRARPRLVVDNYGNTVVTAAVQATVPDNGVDFDIRVPSFQVQPGRAHFSVVKLRPVRLLWFGRKVTHPFTATVQPSGSEPASVAATYVQTALLPGWLSRLAMLLLALVAVFAGLWFLAKPSVTSEATAEVAAAPTPVVQAPSASPSASPSPSPSPSTTRPAVAAPAAPAAAAKSPSVQLPAPVGRWKLNQDSGTIATDSSGNDAATGTNTGWCTITSCATFNGTSSAFTTGTSVLNTGAGKSFTVAAWVYLADIPANGLFATAVSQDGTDNSAFYLQYSGANKCWAFARSGTDATPSPGGGRALGCVGTYVQKWTYLTGVFNSADDQMQIYVNGSAKGTATDSTPYATDGSLAIGRARFAGDATDWFPGDIRDVEVFQTALSSAQVKLLYSQGAQ